MNQTGHPAFIEFEISTYCNRHCAWCPNSMNIRGDSQRYVDAQLWHGFMVELAGARYEGWLAVHNYNEPLLAVSLLWCIETARSVSPQTPLRIYSNGDYLDWILLDKLKEAGVEQLRITLYPPRTPISYESEQAGMRIGRFLRRLKLAEHIERVVETHRGFEVEIAVGGLTMTVTAADPLRYTNRAASLCELTANRGFSRVEPCHVPSRAAAIDVDGNLKLCCQFQDVTAPDAAAYNIGNVAGGNFWALWNGVKMARYRDMLERADFRELRKCGECDKLP